MRVPSKVNVSSRKAGLLVTVALCGASLAGCAESSRLSDPFANPFEASSRYADRTPTASTPRASYNSPSSNSPTYSAPLGRVQSRPLTAPGASASYSAPAAASPRLASAAASAPVSTGGIIRSSGPGGWTGQGGPQVTVGQGETPKILADRYGVPTDALLRVNGYSSASQIAPGTRLTIPVYSASASAAAAPVVAPKAVERVEDKTQKAVEPPKMKFVKGPDAAKGAAKETVDAKASGAGKHAAKAKMAAAKPEAVKSAAKTAKVEDDEEDDKPAATPARDTTRVKKAEAGTKSVRDDASATRDLKGKKSAVETKAKTAKVADDDEDDDAPAVKPARGKQAAAEPKKAEAKPVAEAPKPQTKVAKVEPQQKVAKVEPESKKIDKTPTASLPAASEAKPAATDAANPEFRWPARGRIIQGFKSGGNDGINIAVPEGTSVKAAEGGTVAYAGSELKGYGNLVLIRHPNGFVSAYAHNGDIEVKRGDTVKRGQTIAKSGQSGNVASPQLHFELRKGSTPVDPTSYLAGL